MKHQDPKFSWLNEVSRYAPDQALHHLDTAYDNFFRRIKKGEKGFPRFKSRKDGLGAFELYGSIRLDESGRHIKIPSIGWVRLTETGYIPNIKIKQCTISEKSGKWFISALCEVDDVSPTTKKQWGIVGVDLGIKSLAQLSNGINVVGDDARRMRNRIERLGRDFSRKKKGSRRFKLAKKRLAKLHSKVADIRSYQLHCITKRIARKSSVVGIEDLSVKNMMKNGKLARAIGEKGFGKFRLLLEYKAKWYGCKVVVADKFFPSSKTCSRCGCKRETLSLSERVFVCDSCGYEIDRDLNAAINLKFVAANLAETLNERGGSVSPRDEQSLIGSSR